MKTCLPQTSASSNKSELDFFTFDEDPAPPNCEREEFDYLRSGSEVEVLNNFPNIKTLLIKQTEKTKNFPWLRE